MRLILISFLFVCFSTAVLAQPMNRASPEAMLKVANEQMEKTDFYRAAEWYEKYYEATKDKSVLYPTAMAYLRERDYTKAERFFQRVAENKKMDVSQHPDLKFMYGRTLKMNGKYDEAIIQLSEFVSGADAASPLRALAQAELDGAKMAKTLTPAAGTTVTNAGKEINSANGDYSPSLHPTTGDMYFTAYRQEEIIVVKGEKGDYNSRVMVAKKVKGKYTDAKPVEDDVNREDFHHGNVHISADGKEMYFTRVVLAGNSIGESKIYKSNKQGNGWAPAKEVAGINGAFISKQPALGELFGKSVIFFVSNMEGGKGGFDIYYATRNGEKFENPTNLGTGLNTVGDEETPHYRNGQLYFSSNGHPGMGGADLFSSNWNGSTWSAPVNMGLPYNSAADDMSFSLDQEGYYGALVSNREGTKSLKSKTCCDDIWEVNIEKPVLGLTSLVTSEAKPLAGTNMQLIDMTGGSMGKTDAKSNDKGNNFDFVLAYERTYTLITSKTGFFSDTTTFTTVGLTGSQNMTKNITLRPIPPPPPIEVVDTTIFTQETPISLDNIFYDYRKWDILPEAARELSYLDTLMQQYPDMVIELSSHTDARGNEAANQELSQKRAEAARSYLMSRGVSGERIKPVGYGETRIINQCLNDVTCTEDEHRQNRRTEARIIAGPTSIKVTRKEFKKRMVSQVPVPEPAPAPKPKPGAPKTPAPKPAPKTTPKPAPKPAGGKGNVDTLREEAAIPAAKAKRTDVAEIKFKETFVDFGTIKMGETPSHTFEFTNTSNETIEIELVSGCDCTDLEWTLTPVAPGQVGFIRATYLSERTEAADMNKKLEKDATIILKNTYPENGYPIVYELKFNVHVEGTAVKH